MANVVQVKPDMIRWAVERSGLPLESFPAVVAGWITRGERPTFSRLETFARKAMVPFGYLFLDSPPAEDLPMPDYRTVDDGGITRPSPNLLETCLDMRRRQTWMREYLLEEGHGPIAFVGSFSRESPITPVVADLRRHLNLSLDWAAEQRNWEAALSFLIRQIEAAGILVFVNGVVGNSTKRKLDPEEFRGFVMNDPVVPLIFVNGADTKGAQMFTLAHELAHVWIGESALVNLPDMDPGNHAIEKYCNCVAAEFLVPAERMRLVWPKVAERDHPFHAIARRFKVSPIVAGRRAKDLGLISAEQFFGFYYAYLKAVAEADKKRPSGGDFYRTQNARLGRRFGRAVVAAAESGRLSWQEAYDLTRLHGQTFDRYVAFLKKQEGR
jgi:Zn-dependent peptidase ImmA (M78 family)